MRRLFFNFILRAASCPTVGGQAVMEGVMMRNGNNYGLAVRRPDGSIVAERRPWFSIAKHPLLQKPFLRGFPLLVETLVNGIRTLNRSAVLCAAEEETPLDTRHLILTLLISITLAIGLFVILPHLITVGFQYLGLSGDLTGVSFHAWDGLFKCVIFITYILVISLLPDVRRVFQYHGAEHKTIHAFEQRHGARVDAASAQQMSRLHPRCGTTFMLFVICISIILHAILVPLFLYFWTPQHPVAVHGVTLLFKLFLIIPISALAYELIRYAARMGDGIGGRLLRAPGLGLQLLTTAEPDIHQLEVAVVALREALGQDASDGICTVSYRMAE